MPQKNIMSWHSPKAYVINSWDEPVWTLGSNHEGNIEHLIVKMLDEKEDTKQHCGVEDIGVWTSC